MVLVILELTLVLDETSWEVGDTLTMSLEATHLSNISTADKPSILTCTTHDFTSGSVVPHRSLEPTLDPGADNIVRVGVGLSSITMTEAILELATVLDPPLITLLGIAKIERLPRG